MLHILSVIEHSRLNDQLMFLLLLCVFSEKEHNVIIAVFKFGNIMSFLCVYLGNGEDESKGR